MVYVVKMCKMLELAVTCFACGNPSSSLWARKVSTKPTPVPSDPSAGGEGSIPFYPQLLEGKEEEELTPPPGAVVMEDGTVYLCAFCHALLDSQAKNGQQLNSKTLMEGQVEVGDIESEDSQSGEKSSGGGGISGGWKFLCAVCAVETYRKRVRALPLQKFQFLLRTRKPGSISITLGDSECVVVCLDCSETLWIQSDEYDRWGLPESKRHFNWMARPPPPEDSEEANLARLPSGKSQLPRSPPTEPTLSASHSQGVSPSSSSALAKGIYHRGGRGGRGRRSRSDRSDSTSSNSSSSNVPEFENMIKRKKSVSHVNKGREGHGHGHPAVTSRTIPIPISATTATMCNEQSLPRLETLGLSNYTINSRNDRVSPQINPAQALIHSPRQGPSHLPYYHNHGGSGIIPLSKLNTHNQPRTSGPPIQQPQPMFRAGEMFPLPFVSQHHSQQQSQDMQNEEGGIIYKIFRGGPMPLKPPPSFQNFPPISFPPMEFRTDQRPRILDESVFRFLNISRPPLSSNFNPMPLNLKAGPPMTLNSQMRQRRRSKDDSRCIPQTNCDNDSELEHPTLKIRRLSEIISHTQQPNQPCLNKTSVNEPAFGRRASAPVDATTITPITTSSRNSSRKYGRVGGAEEVGGSGVAILPKKRGWNDQGRDYHHHNKGRSSQTVSVLKYAPPDATEAQNSPSPPKSQ